MRRPTMQHDHPRELRDDRDDERSEATSSDHEAELVTEAMDGAGDVR